MRHRKNIKQLDRKSSVRKALFADLATSLILYEKIKTTQAKAKAIRPVVEKLITTSKKNDLTARRALLQALRHKKAVSKALEVLGPRYKERPGGYTRITHLAPRQGDGAAMCQIEFVK
jgi:large subunit ribosomal protein L17